MARKSNRDKPKHPVQFKTKLIRFGVALFVWLGLAVLYYLVFSFFFDTPAEHEMRRSLVALEKEYEQFSERYDTLQRVLDNVVERDKNIFRTLYDSEPLTYDEEEQTLLRMDSLMKMTNQQLAQTFFSRLDRFKEGARAQQEDLEILQNRILTRGPAMNRIPSIQPVINPDQTQIATSFGMRIHPFYRSMVMHNGMDYAVPEGTRVFATADGTVARSAGGTTTTGTTLVLNHGNGYETAYHHLERVFVRPGATVRRGDIVALTGNSGLSLAPHLHYEVRLDGMRVDPVHYFFYELDPKQYEQVKRQAAVGMQSFD